MNCTSQAVMQLDVSLSGPSLTCPAVLHDRWRCTSQQDITKDRPLQTQQLLARTEKQCDL